MKKYFTISLLFSILVSAFLFIAFPQHLRYKKQNLTVHISLRVDADSSIKLYYSEQGIDDFSEMKSITKEQSASPEFSEVVFEIPATEVHAVRVDCENDGVAAKYMDVESVEVDLGKSQVVLTPSVLSECQKNDIEACEVTETHLVMKLGSSDPFFVCQQRFEAERLGNIDRRLVVAIVAFLFLLGVLLANKAIILDYFIGMWNSRKQLWALSITDFKSRYSGAYLGMFWGVIQPIMTILLFWFVFQVGFRSNPIENVPFILWLVAGMIPWNYFCDAWLGGNTAFTGYSYVVKKLVFNVDVLPVVKVLGASILNFIFNIIIIIVYVLYGKLPGFHILDMVYFSACSSLLVLGLTMVTATLNVFMKDIGQFLSIAMQFIMWLTPIMWDYHMLEAKGLAWFYNFNPLFYIIDGYRNSLIYGKWFFSSYNRMLWFWLVTIALNVLGVKLMRKLKPHFADVL